MLDVDIDKILPLTEARDNFNKIVDDVEGTDEVYVLTKNGKPAAVVVGVNHLEKLTGKSSGELSQIVEKKADETPVVEEVSPASVEDGANTTATEPVVAPAVEPMPPTIPDVGTPTDSVGAMPEMPKADNAVADIQPAAENPSVAPVQTAEAPAAPLAADSSANAPAAKNDDLFV
ncbi:MAG: type II toxin-antitoxin system prevent-host-death family antitoxin [Candidatus Berkelbacteria bacterium]|nr:type II toxin-antitoxin system prevent-host-death family antitoxin [Candidatus Berkelbacteria bacterium]